MQETDHNPEEAVPPGDEKKERVIERGPGFRKGVRDLVPTFTIANVGAGIVAAIFGTTGPALILLDGAEGGGLTTGQTVAWISAVYVFGGLISFTMGLYYKQPIVGAWSIPAAALVASNLESYSLGEMMGAYFLASILVLVLGLSGWMRPLVAWIPMPILMAMIGGVLVGYAVNAVGAAGDAPIVVGSAVVGYLLLGRYIKAVPGVVGALVFGVIAVIATQNWQSAPSGIGWTAPEFTTPELNWIVILGVGIPLALVIQAENTQSMGVLIAEGYRAPVNSITAISGLASVFVAPFGGHNASIAGPMTAICGSPEAGADPNRRYPAAIVNGMIFVLFGVFASIAVGLVTVLPSELVTVLAGLAMFSVLLIAFKGAFGTQRFKLGALVAMLIGLSGISPWGISTPFWALIFGVLFSLIVEPKDFKAARLESQQQNAVGQ